jgi:hypothetical protein
LFAGSSHSTLPLTRSPYPQRRIRLPRRPRRRGRKRKTTMRCLYLENRLRWLKRLQRLLRRRKMRAHWSPCLPLSRLPLKERLRKRLKMTVSRRSQKGSPSQNSRVVWMGRRKSSKEFRIGSHQLELMSFQRRISLPYSYGTTHRTLAPISQPRFVFFRLSKTTSSNPNSRSLLHVGACRCRIDVPTGF